MAILARLTGRDVLSDVLGSLRLEGRIFCRLEVGAPWGFRTPDDGLARFHVLERGTCWIRSLHGPALLLSPGDLVLALGTHQLSDGPKSPTLPMGEFLGRSAIGSHAVVRRRGRGPEVQMLCGAFRFGQGESHPLLAVLPPLIHIKSRTGNAPEWLNLTMQFLAFETRHPRAGSESVVSGLTQLLFTQAVRAWIEDQPEGHGGWLGALRDRQIAQVLGLMHGEPARSWTVPELAREAGMSRATMARRFAILVGEPPLKYLSHWRMLLAADLLRAQSMSVGEAAARVGYQSEAAFSRAFRVVMGMAPARFRRTASVATRRARGGGHGARRAPIGGEA